MIVSKAQATSTLRYAVVALLMTMAQVSIARALPDAGGIKGTVKATTGATESAPAPIPGARVSLANRDLPSTSVKITTDDAGNFAFTNLPAANYLLTVEADGLPTITREINLATGQVLTVEIVLTASVSETVTVREEEGLLSTAETATSNTIGSQTLKEAPLRSENYQSALLLTPGVVRSTDGTDHVKGARAGQSAYTLNGVDITDPVTGQLAFDIPLEAAANVQIEENPYSAEFGRLTGGATNLDTKGGGDKFKFNVTRFFPTFRNIIGGPLDSFRPRLTLSGPLIRKHLVFLQSFEYRFTRFRIPSLKPPSDSSTSENFNSFTQLDLSINKKNRAKFVGALFPQRTRNAGLNTFNPSETTPNIKQRGLLLSISEQAIFKDASFLASTLSYKTFDVDVFPQGRQPLTLIPDGNRGNYFVDAHRRAPRLQWQETYYASPFALGGQHSFKSGVEFDRTRASGSYGYSSILIRRNAGTLAQRVDFTRATSVARNLNELAAFMQDRWVVNKKLTIDAGLRLDRDGIARQSNVAPRLALMFLPFKNDRTIIRGGMGLFSDRIPLASGYFTQLPERVVTTYAPDGATIIDGPRRFSNVIESPLRNARSVRWSLQLDQGLTKNLTARIGYLERSTIHDLIINPSIGGVGGALNLSSSGRSHYRELQLLATYNNPRVGNWNASYAWSSARGDLNTIDNFLGDLPAFVVRPNEYGPLPFDAPHRLLVSGQLKGPSDINIWPLIEIRSGFPFSFVNEQLDFDGPRNRAGRFPLFMSLDVQVTKGFIVPQFVPQFGGRKLRVGAAILNITGHLNPRDVQNNLGSPRVGQFFNSLGTSVRGKFEVNF